MKLKDLEITLTESVTDERLEILKKASKDLNYGNPREFKTVLSQDVIDSAFEDAITLYHENKGFSFAMLFYKKRPENNIKDWIGEINNQKRFFPKIYRHDIFKKTLSALEILDDTIGDVKLYVELVISIADILRLCNELMKKSSDGKHDTAGKVLTALGLEPLK